LSRQRSRAVRIKTASAPVRPTPPAPKCRPSRQADASTNRVEGSLSPDSALPRVEGAVDHVTCVAQRRGELAIEIGIIFNDEQATLAST